MFETLVLCIAAALAGAINSIAGGGTLLTFPALAWALKPEWGDLHLIAANATSTIALCPGSFASSWAYRRELTRYRQWMLWLLGPSLLGSIVGTVLLLWGKPEIFELLVPWLILGATLLFAFQPQIARWIGIGQAHDAPGRTRLAAIMLFQFGIALYGGYFGAGIGILMLSSLALMGLSDIHGMNAVKTLLASLINLVALMFFLLNPWIKGESVIDWGYGVPMIGAGIIGGYVGARVARTLDKNLVRKSVVAIGLTLAAAYFYNVWRGN